MANLVNELGVYGQEHVTVIMNTLMHKDAFNAIARDELNKINVGDRFTDIAKMFNSIREDMKLMIDQIEDGKLTLSERLRNSWSQLTRGSIPKRFDKISVLSTEVHVDAEKTIQRTKSIGQAYMEYRGALQEAAIVGEALREAAVQDLKAAQETFNAGSDKVKNLREAGASMQLVTLADVEKGDLLSELQASEHRVQIAESLVDDLKNSYTVGELVMMRLTQASTSLQSVWMRSVSFFSTNESVLTTLSANMVVLKMTHETTQAHNTMKDGVDQALNDIGIQGNKIQEAALRAAYGPSYKPETVRNLMNSIVTFQENAFQIKKDMRELAQNATKEIEKIGQEGQVRMDALHRRTHEFSNSPQ